MEEEIIKEIKVELTPEEKRQKAHEYNRKYYADHKAKLLGQMKEKVTCDICGRTNISKCNLSKHQKTPRCKKAEEPETLTKQINDLKNMIKDLSEKMGK